jgi:hypothetical protein
MLKYARVICDNVICMQAAGNRTTDQGAVHCAYSWVRQGAQLQEAIVELSEAERKRTGWHGREAATHGIRVATDGQVRPRTLQDHRCHAREQVGVLHCAAHVLAETGAERVEVVGIIELQCNLWRAQQELYDRAHAICSRVTLFFWCAHGQERGIQR